MWGKELTSFAEYFKAYRTISRYEYWPGVAPGMFVALLLGISSLWDILSPFVLETIVLCILLYFSGFVINSLADYELDKKYGTFKSGIPEAVDVIGRSNVKLILALQVIGALLLSLHLAVALNNVWLIVLASFGILFGLGYSAEPFYFKVKGIWHAISLGSSAFFIPLMFIYMVVADPITLPGVLLIIGVTIAHYSLAMANQAADHLEDKRGGVLTPPVRLGLTRTLRWSFIATTAGIIFIMLVIGAIYLSSDSTTALTSGLEGLPVSPMVPLLIIIGVIMLIGYYIPLKGLRDLHGISTESVSEEQRMHRMNERINYASWQASGIFGVTLVLAILFVGGIMAPVSDTTNTGGDTLLEPLDINSLRISNVVVTVDSARPAAYADVTVRMSLQTIEDPARLTEVTAYVDAGTANLVFDTGQAAVDAEGRATVRIDLHGVNASEVWYFVYLVHEGKQSSYTWSEPSKNDLYIFDADISIVNEGLLYDRLQLTISTFNSVRVREEGALTVKIEWAPLVVDFINNNATVNVGQVWAPRIQRDILKDIMSDGSPIKISLYYHDELFDEMQIGL